MISLIRFDSDMVIPKTEAETLKLEYKEIDQSRLGVQEGTIHYVVASYKCIKGVDIKVNGEDKYIDSKGEEVSSYYLYDPLPEHLKSTTYVEIVGRDHMVDLVSFATKCKYPFSIIKSVFTEDTPVNNINYILESVEAKLTTLDKAVQTVTDFNFNSKCNVHIGGGLIVTFNDLKLIEDCCTDALQKELNDGWRMLAVCVQPDQRRPDYILGRYNPNLDVGSNDSAKRG